MSSTAATTEEIKTAPKYTYDYTHLPPLAMVGAVTEAEAFSARPDWIHLVARAALKILINTIMIGVKKQGDNNEFVPQVLKNIQAVAQQLDGETGRDLNKVIATELEKQGSPTTLPQLIALLEHDFLRFLPPLEISKALLDILYLLSSVYYTRLGDYGENYFTDPIIQKHLANFQQELLKIEDEINERNKTRTPYEFLLPSKIPQSINI